MRDRTKQKQGLAVTSEVKDLPAPAAASDQYALSDPLIQARLNYVWDWWKFHAKQRTDMFNYFLIITGILANAYFNLLKDGRLTIAVGLGALGMLTSFGFLMLDVRNRRQLVRATNILKTIELKDPL